MTARIIPLFDSRSQQVAVDRYALSAAAENATASTLSIEAAVKAAEQSVWSGDRAETLRLLGRIGYENQERLPQLLVLTRLSEEAPAICPDRKRGIGHGAAA